MQTESHFFGADKFLFDFAYDAKYKLKLTIVVSLHKWNPTPNISKLSHNLKCAQVPQAIEKIQIARHLFLDF